MTTKKGRTANVPTGDKRANAILTEARFFHMVAVVMGTMLLAVMGWIGNNAAEIPAIRTEIANLRSELGKGIEQAFKRIDDHETRLRQLEGRR